MNFKAWIEIQVDVDVDYQPVEYDTNTPETFEINCVSFHGHDLTDHLSAGEIMAIEEQYREDLVAMGQWRESMEADAADAMRRERKLEAML